MTTHTDEYLLQLNELLKHYRVFGFELNLNNVNYDGTFTAKCPTTNITRKILFVTDQNNPLTHHEQNTKIVYFFDNEYYYASSNSIAPGADEKVKFYFGHLQKSDVKEIEGRLKLLDIDNDFDIEFTTDKYAHYDAYKKHENVVSEIYEIKDRDIAHDRYRDSIIECEKVNALKHAFKDTNITHLTFIVHFEKNFSRVWKIKLNGWHDVEKRKCPKSQSSKEFIWKDVILLENKDSVLIERV